MDQYKFGIKGCNNASFSRLGIRFLRLLGENDLIELGRTLSKVFNTDMPDMYRMFSEIRGRKKDKCRFLMQLIDVQQRLRNGKNK
jgi:hypothetical protein